MAIALLTVSSATGSAPEGGLSALAWAIIVCLAGVIAAVIPALWARGNKIQDRMYEDLKKCNEVKTAQEEEVLGCLKVLRLHMEPPKGGKKS